MPIPSQGHYGFHSFPVVDWFVCLYNYEFWLSLFKIVRSSVILLLPLLFCSIFDFTNSVVDHCMSFCPYFFWLLYCLSFDLRLLITPLVSPSSSLGLSPWLLWSSNFTFTFIYVYHWTILISVLTFDILLSYLYHTLAVRVAIQGYTQFHLYSHHSHHRNEINTHHMIDYNCNHSYQGCILSWKNIKIMNTKPQL